MAKTKDVAINEPVKVVEKPKSKKNYIKQVDNHENGSYTAIFDDGTTENKNIPDYDAFIANFYDEDWQEKVLSAWNDL